MLEDSATRGELKESGSRTSSVSTQAEPSVGEDTNEEVKRKRENSDEQSASSDKRLKSRPSSKSDLPELRQQEMQETARSEDDPATLQIGIGDADDGVATSEEEKGPKDDPKKMKKSCKRSERFKSTPAHQLAEQYVELSSRMMFMPTTHLGPYGYDDEGNNSQHEDDSEPTEHKYPLELISSLGFLMGPLRRPTIIERWSPFEISLFEAGMGHYGKDFYQVHKLIQTKSTKEVIDFYYIWKKTSHYKVWKDQYLSPAECQSGEGCSATPFKKPVR